MLSEGETKRMVVMLTGIFFSPRTRSKLVIFFEVGVLHISRHAAAMNHE